LLTCCLAMLAWPVGSNNVALLTEGILSSNKRKRLISTNTSWIYEKKHAEKSVVQGKPGNKCLHCYAFKR